MKILFCHVCDITIGLLDDDDINEEAIYKMRCLACAVIGLNLIIKDYEIIMEMNKKDE